MRQGTIILLEQQLASKEGVSSMELVGYTHQLCTLLILIMYSMSVKFCDGISYTLICLLLSSRRFHIHYALFTYTVPTDMLLFQQLFAR